MASELHLSTLEDLCTALESAQSPAEVRLISSAWNRRESRTHQSWGDELISDAYRASTRTS